MAKNMWQCRINDNADRDGWWLETQCNDSTNKVAVGNTIDEDESAVVDTPVKMKSSRLWSTEMDRGNKCFVDGDDIENNNEDEGEDEDEDEENTIYSFSRLDPPASHEGFSNHLSSSATNGVNSYFEAPCTLESMSLAYMSFNWAENIEDSQWPGESGQTESAPGTTIANDVVDQLASSDFLTQHVQRAWSQYEAERQSEAVENNRTLCVEKIPKGILSICDWKCIPLQDSYKAHETYALSRPITGRCAYERTPTIVVTNEDGEHFRLLEVRKILSEEQIAEIRRERDLAQEQAQKEVELYDIYNMAALEGQKPEERRAVDAAKAWWDGEQRKRNTTYVDWEHAEIQELELLKRQLEREAEQHMRDQAISEARTQYQRYRLVAAAGQIQHWANLKLKLAKDKLVYVGWGRYVGTEYSVSFDSRALDALLASRDDIDAMTYAIQINGQSAQAKADEREKREALQRRERSCRDHLLKVLRRREAEISNRYAHRNKEYWKSESS